MLLALFFIVLALICVAVVYFSHKKSVDELKKRTGATDEEIAEQERKAIMAFKDVLTKSDNGQ